MHGADNQLDSIVIAAAALIFIVSRQLRARPAKEERGLRVFLILVVIGAYELYDFVSQNPHSLQPLAVLLVGAGLVTGLIFGSIRGTLTHIWRDKGVLMRQGNAMTVILWIIGLAIHLGLDAYSSHLTPASKGLGTASLILYLGLSLGTQKYVILERAKRLQIDNSVTTA